MEQRAGIDGEIVSLSSGVYVVKSGGLVSCDDCSFNPITSISNNRAVERCNRACEESGIDCAYDIDYQSIFVRK